ncbi:pilus assembly protein [Undibacterium sp.]|uniref:pilus assembly protein n=1 Tax=Undibacterium sp. TaxID=1914977 RepID=UPI003751DBF7
MKNSLFKMCVAMSLLTHHLSAFGDDTDLFLNPPTSASQAPNVLIIIDNSANWSSAFAAEKAALEAVLKNLPVDKFRVGLMMFTETGAGNPNPGGGYVRAAMRFMDSTNKTIYADLMASLSNSNPNSDKGNGRSLSLMMAEAYYYYAAKNAYGGIKAKRDYPSNPLAGASYAKSRAVYALPGNAFASSGSTTYVNSTKDGCQNNYIIYIGNATAGGNVTKDNASENSTARNLLSAAAIELGASGTAATAEIPISPSGDSYNVANEWAKFMRKTSPLKIITYTIDVNTATGDPSNSALLRSMATESDGEYALVATADVSSITDAINSVFTRIQPVDSAFASVSLPVSVNTQGTYLNQVFIGMFRPDSGSAPRWAGNLKQYKFGYDANKVLRLQDADSKSAISGNSGFVDACARSFWTPTTADTDWLFRPSGDCLTVAGSDQSNTPDGNVVEKGGQGYRLRQTAMVITRNMQTCSNASCTALSKFDSTSVTSAMLGVGTSAERDKLINWQRGQDLQGERTGEKDDLSVSLQMRPSSHGDVVHSRPVAINYGTDAIPDVVVFYGGNDGALRAVNGNQTGTGAGDEIWSFVPPEFFPKIKRIKTNSPNISFPGYDANTAIGDIDPTPKDYGVDGPVTAYKKGSTAWIFSAMRRGGSAMYAFDMEDAKAPKLKWKIDGTQADFLTLGQTWSSAKVIQSTAYSGPMLVMGGGYDTCQDVDGNANTCGTKGKNIYVLDADSGKLLKKFATDSSVVADVAIVPDSAGLIMFAYAVDLGGNIYRISGVDANTAIGATLPANWTITKIAALGGSGLNNRKFMFTPDIVEDNGGYLLLVGSGDREKPVAFYTNATAVNNYFFSVLDKPTEASWLTTGTGGCGSVICLSALVEIATTTPSTDELAAKKGWYLKLSSTEQVVTSAITVFGTTTFSTHKPYQAVAGVCTATLGEATVYNINYLNAAAIGATRGEKIYGGGLPPSPVAGMVIVNGKAVPFIVGSTKISPLEGTTGKAPPAVKRPKSRVSWHVKK